MKKTIMFMILGWMMLTGLHSIAADEILLRVYLQAKKGNSSITRSPTDARIDWAGSRFASAIFTASTSWAPLSKGSVDTNGICYVQNLSTNITQYLSFNNGTTTNLTIGASEFFVFRCSQTFNPTNISYKAESGTPDLEFTILEN